MHYHIVGIGGAGMNAIAHILLDRGDTVSGSDATRSAAWAPLQERGVQIALGHAAVNIAGADAVLATSAARHPHPELDAAQSSGIPILRRHDLWRTWSTERNIIAVAGTHGKTTTTAMIAVALQQAGLNPGYLIGAEIPDLPRTAAWGDSTAPFVIEADEYDRTFLALTPFIAIITTLEWDHVDIYPDADDYARAFETFVGSVPKAHHVLVCASDAGVVQHITRPGIQWYGIDEELARNPVACTRIPLDWSATGLSHSAAGQRFQLWHYDPRSLSTRLHAHVQTPLAGLHNVANTVAAYAVAVMAGAAPDAVVAALAGFRGAKRRFEQVGSVADVRVIDDYGHHPTEVRVVLAAARQRYGTARIVAYVQPHTFSRTQMLVSEWADAFGDADIVCIGDIYASREQPIPGVDAAWLVRHISHSRVTACGTIAQSVAHLCAIVQPGDVVITLSAGDGTTVGPALLAALAATR
jgi:UDP-N-acetylmuramate--alanine ligase